MQGGDYHQSYSKTAMLCKLPCSCLVPCGKSSMLHIGHSTLSRGADCSAFTEGTVNMHKKNFTYSCWYKLVGRLRQTEQTGGHLLTELQEVELCEALVAGHNAERALALAQLDDDRLVWIIQVDHMRWLRSDH